MRYIYSYLFYLLTSTDFIGGTERYNVEFTCAANELAASAPPLFTASSEPPGSAIYSFVETALKKV